VIITNSQVSRLLEPAARQIEYNRSPDFSALDNRILHIPVFFCNDSHFDTGFQSAYCIPIKVHLATWGRICMSEADPMHGSSNLQPSALCTG